VKQFLDDISRLAACDGSWVIPVLEATGPRSRPTQFHFCYNSNKHDSSYDDPASLVKDYSLFDALYGNLEKTLAGKYDYKCDKNEFYAVGKANFGHRIVANNIFTLRVEAFIWIYDSRYLAIAKDLADSFHNVLEPEREQVTPPEMLKRPEGKDFGMQDYVD
ncbi:MAG: hypothetical protein IKY71_03355, partial [Bacteroidaceae bacterium]|nr:hypothetical protein [Bacteroidaceae bacterium]